METPPTIKKLIQDRENRDYIVKVSEKEDLKYLNEIVELFRRKIEAGTDLKWHNPQFFSRVIAANQAMIIKTLEDKFAGFMYSRDDWDNRFVSTGGFLIDENFSGKGLGRQAKEFFLKESLIPKHPQSTFFTVVVPDDKGNPVSQKLNEKLGYKTVLREDLPQQYWKETQHLDATVSLKKNGKVKSRIPMIYKP